MKTKWDNQIALFDQIRSDLESAKCKHVQVLHGIKDGRLAMKFLYVDSPKYKEKVREICDKYCEDMELIKETKTTLTYILN